MTAEFRPAASLTSLGFSEQAARASTQSRTSGTEKRVRGTRASGTSVGAAFRKKMFTGLYSIRFRRPVKEIRLPEAVAAAER
jgi:hypothetical protein